MYDKSILMLVILGRLLPNKSRFMSCKMLYLTRVYEHALTLAQAVSLEPKGHLMFFCFN